MSDNPVLFEVDGGAATITLNRPDVLNSINDAMARELRAALDRVAADASIRAVLITGAGRGFCAGQDLSDRAVAPGAEPIDLGVTIETKWNPIVRAIMSLPKPVVAAVNGAAAGAGANLALVCDLTLAAEDAKFVQAFCRLGLVPDSGGTWILPRRVGLQRAMGLSLLGEPITGAQAADWGLIWKAYPKDELLPAAKALAAYLATQPTAGLAKIKHALRASFETSLDAQLDLERDLQREAGFSDDYREGVAAFLEKRPASFTGR